MSTLHMFEENNIVPKINFTNVKSINNKRLVTSYEIAGQRRTDGIKRAIGVDLARNYIEDGFHSVLLNIINRVLINQSISAV